MIRYLLLVLVLMGQGCKGQEKVGGDTKENTLTLLLRDNYGGSESQDFRVIRDTKTLRQFIVQVNKTRKPGLPVPIVDFSKELVVLYCPGSMVSSGAYELYIREDSSEKVVFSVKAHKGEQKVGNQAIIMPFSLYTIPFTEREILLQKE